MKNKLQEVSEAILALSVDSKEKVIEIVNKALVAGGKPSKEPQDHGFMYGWSFEVLTVIYGNFFSWMKVQ